MTNSCLNPKYEEYGMLEQGHTNHTCQKLEGWIFQEKKIQHKIAPNHECHTLL